MINKKQLIEVLTESNRYQETDEPLVDELFFNLKLLKKAKAQLNKDGILSQGDKDGKIMYTHPAYKIYSSVLKDVLSLSIRLGLSERDRRQMGVEGKDGVDDGFKNF